MQGRREGDVFMESFKGSPVLPLGCVVDVALDIAPGGAGQLAGGTAVAHVIREEQLKGQLSGAEYPVGHRLDLHTVVNGHGTGPDQVFRSLDLDQADRTSTVKGQVRIVT